MFWMWGKPDYIIPKPAPLPMYSSGPAPAMVEFKLLQLRNLILQKELLVAKASNDIATVGKWNSDYETQINETLNPDIDALIKYLVGEN